MVKQSYRFALSYFLNLFYVYVCACLYLRMSVYTSYIILSPFFRVNFRCSVFYFFSL